MTNYELFKMQYCMTIFDDEPGAGGNEPAADDEEEDPTTVAADVEPAISIYFTSRLADSIKVLQRALGITQMKPVGHGNLVKQYKTVVDTFAEGYEEGKEIPITHSTRKLANSWEAEIDPVRVTTTLQAIQKVGRQAAINEKDNEVIKKIRAKIKAKFTAMIAAGTGVATAGATLQAAAANVWGALSAKYEDKDVTPVFFINPLDAAAYLGSAAITTQTAFGITYLENFLGLGNAFISAGITQGKVYGTVTENLNGIYIPVDADGNEFFGFTADETGLIAMKHSARDASLAVDTIALSGVTFYPEEVDGVFAANIGA